MFRRRLNGISRKYPREALQRQRQAMASNSSLDEHMGQQGILPDDVKIKEGDQVILKKGNTCRVFQIRKNRDIWLDKIKFTLDGAIGCNYGSTFEVKKGKMFKINKTFKEGEVIGAEKGIDNRDLHDLDSNQKLSREDIVKLKKEGAKGKEIIGQLIENSTTFKGKTEYAQEKWVKKKKQKHVSEFTVLKPNTRLLCQMYHEKAPNKILYLRLDTVAQMLSYGNVHAYTNVAVVDTCVGMMVGAVMERVGGYGNVIHFHPGERPVRPVVDYLNFPPEFLDRLYSFPLNQVNSLKNPDSKNGDIVESKSNSESKHINKSDNCVKTFGEEFAGGGDNSIDVSKSDNVCLEESNKDLDPEEKREHSNEQSTERSNKRKHVEQTKREANKILVSKKLHVAKDLLNRKIDCLIIASKFNPTQLVTALVEYVAPSRPVVIYSPYKEAVMDAYAYLRETGFLVNYRLTEAWLRDHQVLPMRTHPLIQMSAGGGYLLTATTLSK